MTTKNVRVKFIRPQYKNLREWTEDPSNIYIGRGGIVFIDNQRFPKENSPWHNPFKIRTTREAVLKKYEIYIRKKLDRGELDISELVGKNLGCWCHPKKCHGHILEKLINETKNRRAAPTPQVV